MGGLLYIFNESFKLPLSYRHFMPDPLMWSAACSQTFATLDDFCLHWVYRKCWFFTECTQNVDLALSVYRMTVSVALGVYKMTVSHWVYKMSVLQWMYTKCRFAAECIQNVHLALSLYKMTVSYWVYTKWWFRTESIQNDSFTLSVYKVSFQIVSVLHWVYTKCRLGTKYIYIYTHTHKMWYWPCGFKHCQWLRHVPHRSEIPEKNLKQQWLLAF